MITQTVACDECVSEIVGVPVTLHGPGPTPQHFCSRACLHQYIADEIRRTYPDWRVTGPLHVSRRAGSGAVLSVPASSPVPGAGVAG